MPRRPRLASTLRPRLATILIAALAGACGSTGREQVPMRALARGAAPAPIDVDGWTVTLRVAELGLGPFYFCASAAASADLCPSAVAELTEVAAIDALDPAAQSIGEGMAVHGETVRSFMFNYAILWLATESAPTPAPAAPGGHSLHLEGSATKDGVTVEFLADVDVAPTLRGAQAIEGVPLRAPIDGEAMRLEISVDPGRWLSAVDFQGLADLGEGPAVIAAGTTNYNAIALAMTTRPPILTLDEDPTP